MFSKFNIEISIKYETYSLIIESEDYDISIIGFCFNIAFQNTLNLYRRGGVIDFDTFDALS